MRAAAFVFLASSLACAALGGCIDRDTVQVESFTPGPAGSFVYSAQTNTVMTANDDGTAEMVRRDWLARALEANAMCRGGYAVVQRGLAIPPEQPAFATPPDDLAFGNTGDVVYNGTCL
jgi:hypothetical protein